MSGGGGAGAASSGGGVGPEVWKGLLQWTMEHHDGTTDPALGPMAEEKKRWLEQVMEGTFVDLAKVMRGLLDRLDAALLLQEEEKEAKRGKDQQGKEEEAEASAAAESSSSSLSPGELWEELQEHVENLDFALVFCQVGGLATLFKYLQQQQQQQPGAGAEEEEEEEASSSSMESNNKKSKEDVEAQIVPALGVLATLTQNNPRVQAEVLAYCAQPGGQPPIDLLVLLCRLVEAPGSSARLRAKALHALSCAVRAPGPTPLEQRFLADFAKPLFTSALSPRTHKDGNGEDDDDNDEDREGRVPAKALFFLQALLGADHADPALATGLGLPLLPLVAPCLAHPELAVRSAAMAVVAELANLLQRQQGQSVGSLLDDPAGGPALRGAMEARQAAIAGLAPGSVEREEAAEEEGFWALLASGGRFLRDGEAELAAHVAAVVAAGAQQQHEQQQAAAEAAEAEAAPVLLLEPPKLSGASQAP